MMRWSAKSIFMAVFLVSMTFAAHAACIPGTSVSCPAFTAPAVVSAPGVSMGGTITAIPSAPTLLFNGATPPNGFMVQLNSAGEPGQTGPTAQCWVNDNGPASHNPSAGFLFGGASGSSSVALPFLFVTPTGYRPIGPVSIFCDIPLVLEVRGW